MTTDVATATHLSVTAGAYNPLKGFDQYKTEDISKKLQVISMLLLFPLYEDMKYWIFWVDMAFWSSLELPILPIIQLIYFIYALVYWADPENFVYPEPSDWFGVAFIR